MIVMISLANKHRPLITGCKTRLLPLIIVLVKKSRFVDENAIDEKACFCLRGLNKASMTSIVRFQGDN